MKKIIFFILVSTVLFPLPIQALSPVCIKAIKKNSDLSIYNHCQKDAASADPDAMYFLGMAHKRSKGFRGDQKKAIEWLTKALEAGNASAQAPLEEIALFNIMPNWTKVLAFTRVNNCREAYELFPANENYPFDVFNTLCSLSVSQTILRENYADALKGRSPSVLRSIDKEIDRSFMNIESYVWSIVASEIAANDNNDLEKKYTESAEEFFAKLYGARIIVAKNILNSWRKTGRVKTGGNFLVIDSYDRRKKAADNGDADEQYWIARMYMEGIRNYVKQDFHKAAEYYQMSADGGNTEAADKLKKIKDGGFILYKETIFGDNTTYHYKRIKSN